MDLIKNKKKKNSFFSRFLKIYFFATIIITSLFLIIFFNTSIPHNFKKDLLHRIYFNGINNYLYLPEIIFSALKSQFIETKKINIQISYKDTLVLEKNRLNILSESNLSSRDQESDFQSVSGIIDFDGYKIDSKIRLKGDRITHFDKKYSSYKIDLKDQKIFNTAKFSLIKPRARNYIHEWLFHKLAGEGGLININYEYINLSINGSSKGLYVFEENFSKDLVERNKRRDGPIFSINEEFTDFTNDSIQVELYEKNFWDKSENQNIKWIAEKNLENFFNGKVSANEVMDLEKWLWFFAVTDLTYTTHGLSPRNVKFFYNPLSALIEPIPYDGHRFVPNFSKHLKQQIIPTSFDLASKCITIKDECNDYEYYGFLKNFFYDQNNKLIINNFTKYQLILKKITSDIFLNTFFEKNKKSIEKINNLIYGDYFLIDIPSYSKFGPGFYYFSIEDTYHRANELKKKLISQKKKILVKDNGDNIIISNNGGLSNFFILPVELNCEQELNYNKIKIVKKINNKEKLDNKKAFLINKDILPDNTKCLTVKFYDQLNDEYFVKSINFLTKKADLKDIKDDFFHYKRYFELEKKFLVLKEDVTIIERDVYIPEGFTVKIFAGQKIFLKNSSIILSESAWYIGEKDKEMSYIGGNKDEFGGGLVIKTKNKNKSFIYNTTFSFLRGPKDRFLKINEKLNIISSRSLDKNRFENITLSLKTEDFMSFDKYNFLGAVNVYNSDLEIFNSFFNENNAEDAINIISSNFKIEETTFKNNSSDSIDIDFSNGLIRKVKILNSGNDGVDLSGSNVLIENLEVDHVNDKGVSIGENAIVDISGATISNAFVGIASKDGSQTNASGIKINNTKIPFAAYQKKKSYDFGSLFIKQPFFINNYLTEALKDKNSIIILSSKKIKKYNQNYNEIIYNKNLKLLDDININ